MRESDNHIFLFEAIEQQNSKIVHLLLEHGAFPNALNYDKKTPMWIAAQMGNPEIVEALFEKQADIEARCIVGVDPKNTSTPLMIAAQSRHSAVVNFLVQKKANISACDKYGKTALMYPAEQGHNHVVLSLIASGANIEATD